MIDNREILDQESIANVLNDVFADIGSNLASYLYETTQIGVFLFRFSIKIC